MKNLICGILIFFLIVLSGCNIESEGKNDYNFSSSNESFVTKINSENLMFFENYSLEIKRSSQGSRDANRYSSTIKLEVINNNIKILNQSGTWNIDNSTYSGNPEFGGKYNCTYDSNLNCSCFRIKDNLSKNHKYCEFDLSVENIKNIVKSRSNYDLFEPYSNRQCYGYSEGPSYDGSSTNGICFENGKISSYFSSSYNRLGGGGSLKLTFEKKN